MMNFFSLSLIIVAALVSDHPGGGDEHPAETPPSGLARSAPAQPPSVLTVLGARESHSLEGARWATGVLQEKLLRPAGRIDRSARANCHRFASRLEGRLKEVGSCGDQLDGLEVLGMCQYLQGDLQGAQAAVKRLVNLRCDKPGERGDGYARSFRLAERWIWPEVVADVAKARGAAQRAQPARGSSDLDKLALLRRLRAAIGKSLGSQRLSSGVVVSGLERGSVAMGAGLRVGDIIVNVGSRPVSDHAGVVSAASGGSTRVIYLRGGKRREGILKGPPKTMKVAGVPEQFLR